MQKEIIKIQLYQRHWKCVQDADRLDAMAEWEEIR